MRFRNKVYAGIGSRKCPEHILKRMYDIGYERQKEGWTLRSGGAKGADTAFYEGAMQALRDGHGHISQIEVFIPWNGYNGHVRNPQLGIFWIADKGLLQKAQNMVKTVMNARHWGNLDKYGRDLHARNYFQVHGGIPHGTVREIIYWCPVDGKGNPKGGTATALKLGAARKCKLTKVT